MARNQPVAANMLDRHFQAAALDERWVADTSELVTSTERLYLAVIIDLVSRMVVGWALSASNDRHLTRKALEMALGRRSPAPGLVHHSDQGCTYASEDYQRMPQNLNITCSISRRGNWHDNAVAESWCSTMKSELGERFESNANAKAELFDQIEVFYNRQRLHSVLGYVSPAAFEEAWRMRQES